VAAQRTDGRIRAGGNKGCARENRGRRCCGLLND